MSLTGEVMQHYHILTLNNLSPGEVTQILSALRASDIVVNGMLDTICSDGRALHITREQVITGQVITAVNVEEDDYECDCLESY